MRLANDSSSFTPVHSQIRAIGPRDLHLAKGRGQEKAMAEMAALLVLRKKWEAFCSEDAEG